MKIYSISMKQLYVKASSDQGWLHAAQALISKAMQEKPEHKKMVIKETKLFTPGKYRLSGWSSE